MHAEEESLDSLLHLHTLQLDVLGQSGQCILDAALGEQKGRVRIGTDFEYHRDGEETVARRLTGNVVHALDSVDGLLEWRCNSAGNRVGRGARVGRRDLNGWRNDGWILSNRQKGTRREAEQHEEDINDRSEARMVDEEVGEFHDIKSASESQGDQS